MDSDSTGLFYYIGCVVITGILAIAAITLIGFWFIMYVLFLIGTAGV